jgi:hypothetical protein
MRTHVPQIDNSETFSQGLFCDHVIKKRQPGFSQNLNIRFRELRVEDRTNHEGLFMLQDTVQKHRVSRPKLFSDLVEGDKNISEGFIGDRIFDHAHVPKGIVPAHAQHEHAWRIDKPPGKLILDNTDYGAIHGSHIEGPVQGLQLSGQMVCNVSLPWIDVNSVIENTISKKNQISGRATSSLSAIQFNVER